MSTDREPPLWPLLVTLTIIGAVAIGLFIAEFAT